MPKQSILKVKYISLGGVRRLDIRRYVVNGNGELLPTKRGISLPPDKIEEIIKAMQEAGEHEVDIQL